ncbi:hypothetical protein [Agarivorans sp. Toyoura001]|uniref:hypothetical protein n=1 Tax=Agarivorans sp. Toyoura001 TaxID=2283141 RepID=UPI0010F9932C|nr:hypothetical protein [Agarivorans sp. Toyoura001]
MSSLLQSLVGPNGLILLGALISTIGVVWSSNLQTKVNNKLEEQGREIISQAEIISEKSTEINEKNDELLAKSSELQLKSDQLIDKGEEINKLNVEILNHTTGGDSYPELTIESLDGKTNSGQLIISNVSDNYNMYELQVRIYDLASKVPRTLENMTGDDKILDVGNIPAKTASTQGMINLGNITEKKLNIFSQTRNGSFVQELRLKKINGEWLAASRIKTFDGEMLKENIDDHFPLNTEQAVEY